MTCPGSLSRTGHFQGATDRTGVGAMAVRPAPSHRSSRVPATPPSDRSTPGSAGSPDLAARAGAGVGPAREEER